ncbi:lipid-A-disaccharide synthase [Bradyrhizobium prioriisuperbiae]|uniref:lipid-A-disaccharide synthase n=1 Tax=Bradyrhizobium prioriisuperbiae TaxID=2854389 RepID=UPI0028EE271F|nr:lipid-A-disaccharide synthase [Bradyrhizobium prioritasuperba]
MTTPPRTIFLVATEESGDRLGGPLMAALRARCVGDVAFAGVGGRDMVAQGLTSLFPIEELSIMGLAAIARKLPMILRRIRQVTAAVLKAKPDVLVIIDSPDFTHRVARRVRKADPSIPIVDYVSPSVWAWRPGRARAMRRYVDHVLALLPFEPEAHRTLGGPPCTYVGHPLIQQLGTLRPDANEQRRRDAAPPVLLVLPGSRRSEIRHHMQVFGDTLGRLRSEGVSFDLILPTTPHLRATVEAALQTWPLQPRLAVTEDEKKAAFRIAHAALAKSGTVTLELALAGVPMVTAYKGTAIEAFVARRMVRIPTVILANLVIGEAVVPEFMQEDCVPETLVPALRDILGDTAARRKQVEAFGRLDGIMSTGAQSPSERCAEIVLATLRPSAG